MARLFIAIRFNDEFKRKLVEIQDSLKARGVKGNYCSYGNLHMTLAFIGEHYDLPAIRKTVNEVEFEQDGVYYPIWQTLQEDNELSAVVRSRQLHIYRNGKKILVLAGKAQPKVIREDKLISLL